MPSNMQVAYIPVPWTTRCIVSVARSYSIVSHQNMAATMQRIALYQPYLLNSSITV